MIKEKRFVADKKFEKTVLKVIKDITQESSITVETNIINDLYIDSFTWIQIIEKLEEKIGEFDNLEDLFEESSDMETIGEVIDLFEKYSN